jgi:hypothetical protein
LVRVGVGWLRRPAASLVCQVLGVIAALWAPAVFDPEGEQAGGETDRQTADAGDYVCHGQIRPFGVARVERGMCAPAWWLPLWCII